MRNPEMVTFQNFRILLVLDESRLDYRMISSPGLELIIFLHTDGFPLFVPPPAFADLTFLGYYAITLHNRGIALFKTPDCPRSTVEKIPEFLKDLQGNLFFFSHFTF
jgi:hypothetical protein